MLNRQRKCSGHFLSAKWQKWRRILAICFGWMEIKTAWVIKSYSCRDNLDVLPTTAPGRAGYRRVGVTGSYQMRSDEDRLHGTFEVGR